MKKYVNIAFITGLVLVIYSFLNFSLNQIWDWVSTVSLILGAVVGGIAVYYHLKFRERAMNKRTLQYGANTVLSSVIVLGILVLLAFLSTRHHYRADLTGKGLFSLAKQTKDALRSLKKEVKFIAFYRSSEQERARDLLNEYAYRSKFVSYKFVDPNEKPQLARQYKVTNYNTIVVESGGKRESVTDLSESNLTNALVKVTRELDKTVYFVTGHGEHPIDSDQPEGYKTVADGIKNENYIVKSLNLPQDKKIPEDCSVLVIAGPKANFFPFELDSLKQYINNGGRVLVLLDPEWKPALPNFLKNYKISVDDDIVVDASGIGRLMGMGPQVPLVTRYEKHDIFKDFRITTFFPLAVSVHTLEKGDDDVTTQVLFRSTTRAWGETKYKAREVSFNSKEDIRGPLPLAVVATRKKGDKKGIVLVIGDSDFAINGYVKNSGNYDLFLNTVNWLAEEEDMITIRPKRLDDRRVNLTVKQSKLIFYISVIGLPLAIILAGVGVYFKRR